MIQRVQSIYLFLVFILISITVFLPVIGFQAGDQVFFMSIFRFDGVENISFVEKLPNIWPLPILSAILGITSLLSLFRYHNRRQQLMLNMFNLLINFGLLISILFYADFIAKFAEVNDKVEYQIAAYFPIITVALIILANRNIRKDDNLVKESDRLR